MPRQLPWLEPQVLFDFQPHLISDLHEEGRWYRRRSACLQPFWCFLQAFSAGEVADQKEVEQRSKAGDSAPASTPITVSESHKGGVDVSIGLASLHTALPALTREPP